MLTLILDKVKDLAFLIWDPIMIRPATIDDVCISINVTLCN